MEPLQAPALSAAQKLGTGRTAGPSPHEIQEVAEKFEAIFLRQLLRDLRKTATLGDETSYMAGFYGDMLDEQLADQMAKTGGIGLGSVIRAYLERSTR